MKLVVDADHSLAAKNHSSAKRYEVDEDAGELRVYDQSKVQLKEVLPHLIKPKRAYRHFCKGQTGQVSWKALQETVHRTRSIDDIRNYWMLKVLPILQTFGGSRKRSRTDSGVGGISVADVWTEGDDIGLLEGIEI